VIDIGTSLLSLSDLANAYGDLFVTSVSVTGGHTGITDIEVTLRTRSGHNFLNGWIPCSSALPETDDEVIVSRVGDVGVASYWGRKDGWSISPPPTHWRKMPPPAETR
jgi:hypothetical protein